MLMGIIEWRPGVHDPTITAWLVTIAYLASALGCGYAGRGSLTWYRTAAMVWLALGVTLLFLGINKQLDLQTLIIEVGRSLSREQGWYEQRRVVLGLFLAGAAGGVVFVVTVVFRNLSAGGWELRAALAGSSLLIVMLLAQAGPYAPLAEVLNQNLLPNNGALFEVQAGEILELGFLSLVAWSARRSRYVLETEE